MTYTAVLSATLTGTPTLGDIRIAVDGQTISSGITATANSNGAGFEATVVTLSDGFRGPFTFYDSTDAANFATGSVGPEDELLDSMGSVVWNHGPRTLTSSPAQAASIANGSALALTRTTTFEHTFVGAIPANWERAIFTVKTDEMHTDAQSVFVVRVTNPSDAGDGLSVLSGAPGTLGLASLLVIQPGGTIDLTISDDATVGMTTMSGARYDVKLILSDSTSYVFAAGTFSVGTTPTWEI